MAAFQDISQNPANVSKYEDNPRVKKSSGDEFGEKRKENGEKWEQLFKTLYSDVINELYRLRKELKIGHIISHNVSRVLFFMIENELRPSNFRFTEVGGGGFGDCYLVQQIENENIPFSLGTFIAKKLKESDQQEIVQEIARILLITTLGHYGIIEAKTFEHDGKLGALVLGEVDSAQNMTMYVTMNYIEGRSLEEAIERKELTDFDRLRIAVRVADTLKFLHSYKLAHCDLKLDNIMLKKDTNDPVLIDLGNMRTNLNADFSTLDSSSYQVMIYRLFKDCQATQIPPVVKPIFDKWDDEDHMKMPLADLTKRYFGKLSAYNADISICDSTSGLRSTVPRRSGTCIWFVDFEATQSSKSFVEYLEKAVMTLDEHDKMIRDYVELGSKIDYKHPKFQPPYLVE